MRQGGGERNITYPMSLCEWISDQGEEGVLRIQMLLKATRKKLWRDVISHILKEHGT